MSVPALAGTYTPPAVRSGDHLRCHLRRRAYVVTGFAGPLAWPIGRPDGVRGNHGVIVTAELLKAVRAERATALAAALGLTPEAVRLWRRLLRIKVRRPRPPRPKKPRQPGRRAVEAAARRTAMGARAAALGFPAPHYWVPGGWTPEQMAPLGTASDYEVAERIGKTPLAVKLKRHRLGIKMWTAGQ